VKFAAPAAAWRHSGIGLCDHQYSTGQVTGIVITEPGTYAAGETPSHHTPLAAVAPLRPSIRRPEHCQHQQRLTKKGAGTLTLSATNTFTGPLTISGGTVITATINPIGVASPLGAGIATNTTTNAASLGARRWRASIHWWNGQHGSALYFDQQWRHSRRSGAGGITFTDTTAIALTGSGARTLTLQGTTAAASTLAGAIGDAAGRPASPRLARASGSEREQHLFGLTAPQHGNSHLGRSEYGHGRSHDGGSHALNINNSGSGGTSSALGTGTFVINGGTINKLQRGCRSSSTNNVQSWNGDFTFTGTQALDLAPVRSPSGRTA